MKKSLLLIFVAVFLFSFTGCMHFDVIAPEGKTFKLSDKELTNSHREKTVFYALWGLVPITDNTTVDMLADVPDGSEITVKVETTPLNFIINIFGWIITIQSQTVGGKYDEKNSEFNVNNICFCYFDRML